MHSIPGLVTSFLNMLISFISRGIRNCLYNKPQQEMATGWVRAEKAPTEGNGLAMASSSLKRLLTQLDECRYRFGRHAAASAVQLLSTLAKRRFPDVASLIRFHESLLFLRAFPHSPGVVRTAERLLRNFPARVNQLRVAGVDMGEFDALEVSGIASTSMQDTLSFDVVRWLLKQVDNVEIIWDESDAERALAAIWPKFIPLIEEDAQVEADVPWQRWLHAAKKRGNDLRWLVRQFESLSIPDIEKSQLYDSLRLMVRWPLNDPRLSRTRNWKPVRRIFYHHGPLIGRREVSLAQELVLPPPILHRLSRREGEAMIKMVREVMLVRYRELYGTTLGDPGSVVRADVGRGVSIYLWNLPPARRLPLRAYVAGFTLKNGVPINYIEAIGLFEWMEVGFNTFYAFRGGEVAWIYAQALRCLCRLMGTTCISMYPYQLGHDNDEAIESGAFWFYRKLGFRPGRLDLLKLTKREEQKMVRDATYRTSSRILRRLAQGHAFYELPDSNTGAWNTFSTRNIGLKVNQWMSKNFEGNSQRFRKVAGARLARVLGVFPASWSPLERTSFENFAVVLSRLPELHLWSEKEKLALMRIIRAKSAANEMLYLRLSQKHSRLREVLLKLGS